MPNKISLTNICLETTTLYLNKKPLFFTSFAQSGIKKIKDILYDDNTRVKADGDIFNELHYKRNWISEWSKMKSVVKKYNSEIE